MNLGDILSPQQIVPELKATTRWEVIDELIGTLVSSGHIPAADREAVTAVVKKREQSMSTGIGFGIGIPHASTDLIPSVVAAFGRSKAGIQFDALDNQPVHLVTLFLVPQGQFQKHLHTLAGIAKVLRKEEFLRGLDAAQDATAIMDVIRQHSLPR
jgi:mannitol/fructose-specific phosphotransferase system IIA component (Ntr-type)